MLGGVVVNYIYSTQDERVGNDSRSFVYVGQNCGGPLGGRHEEDTMAGSKKPNTVAVATQLAEPVIEEMGLMLWDVR